MHDFYQVSYANNVCKFNYSDPVTVQRGGNERSGGLQSVSFIVIKSHTLRAIDNQYHVYVVLGWLSTFGSCRVFAVGIYGLR